MNNRFGAANLTGGHPTGTTKHKQNFDHSFYRSFNCISNVQCQKCPIQRYISTYFISSK